MASEHPSGRDRHRSAGVVYTPEGLAEFVVDRLLDGYPMGRSTRWLDPACGHGVFLVEAVRRLSAVVAPAELPCTVEDTIFGVDIDPDACAKARVAVSGAVAEVAGVQPPDYFASNLTAGDFLALPHRGLGSFHLVVGNPPYVSAQSLSAADKERFLRCFATAHGRLDLYSLFFEHAMSFVTHGGRLGFVTPDKFLSAESSRGLRAFLVETGRPRSVDRFDRHDLFPGVATVPCVSVIEARGEGDRGDHPVLRLQWWDLGNDRRPVPLRRPQTVGLLPSGRPWSPQRIHRARTVPLGALVERVSAGLATGLNACFVVPNDVSSGLEPRLLRPAVRGRDITVEGLKESHRALILPFEFEDSGPRPRLVDLDAYPGLREHLRAHRPALEQRHCVRVWSKRWYDLHDPVTIDLAARDKILVPDLARYPRFVFDPGQVVPLHSAYYLLPRAEGLMSPQILTLLLNSRRVGDELHRNAATAKSGYRRFRAQFLRELAIPRLTVAEQDRLLDHGPSKVEGDALEERASWALGPLAA